jgi:hypothetical protein
MVGMWWQSRAEERHISAFATTNPLPSTPLLTRHKASLRYHH